MACMVVRDQLMATHPSFTAAALALRVFGVGLNLAIILAELGWFRIMTVAPLLEYWPFKGCFIVYVGLSQMASCLQMDEANIAGFADAVSYTLIGCGVVYTVSGILCIQMVLEWRRQKRKAYKDNVQELQELENRRTELKQLID
eukprot:TRINITY_DN28409_c0_g1_i1.p1 TRINITY_DN28409_c0_g1~~TRINITY_DN28409_c0_g1_i1.p1  ORF type:complete len:144 (+),score=30.92 TRINITY_DN28409_c0_g1_i1:253-684(+)